MKKANKHILFIISVTFAVSLASCGEKKTDDPQETYKFWAGDPTEKNMTVIHGRYWQSGHWTKEYFLYLELNAPSCWRKQFIIQNHLVEAEKNPDIPSDAPPWFTPGKGFRVFVPDGFSQGSMYFEDTSTGKMFIYEIQL